MPGSRIDPADCFVVKKGEINHFPIELDKIYTVSTTEYISGGKDGFDEFLNMKIIRDEHESFDITDMMVKIF